MREHWRSGVLWLLRRLASPASAPKQLREGVRLSWSPRAMRVMLHWHLLCCRSDLEKAISAHGGPSVVAQQLGWKLKAKGRWACGITQAYRLEA